MIKKKKLKHDNADTTEKSGDLDKEDLYLKLRRAKKLTNFK